jgi:hypothetical protein
VNVRDDISGDSNTISPYEVIRMMAVYASKCFM